MRNLAASGHKKEEKLLIITFQALLLTVIGNIHQYEGFSEDVLCNVTFEKYAAAMTVCLDDQSRLTNGSNILCSLELD
jgi:hypothetical protein